MNAIVAWDNLGRPSTSGGGCPAKPCPADPGQPRGRADHQAGARHVGRLRPPADAEHVRPRPARQVPGSRSPTRSAESTPASSSSAAARTSTSASSPTPRSAPRCAAPTRSPGTRPRGSTSTSRATRAPTRGCSRPAGATTPPRRDRPDGDGNLFSFYYRSRLDISAPSGARFTCEDLRAGCAGMSSRTAGPAATRTSTSRTRLTARRPSGHQFTPRIAASMSRSRSTSPRMPAAASLKRKASARRTIAYARVAGSTGRLVGPGANLGLDQGGDPADHVLLHDPRAGGDDPQCGVALLLDELAQRGRVGQAAVEAVERVEQRLARPRPRAPERRGIDQRVRRGGQHLADQLLARPEPAVDGGAPEAELGGDGLDVDALTAQVAVHGRCEDVLAAGGGGAARGATRLWEGRSWSAER